MKLQLLTRRHEGKNLTDTCPTGYANHSHMGNTMKNDRIRLVLLCLGLSVAVASGGCSYVASSTPGVSLAEPVERANWSFGNRTGQALSTTHYNIYTTSGNRNLLNWLPGFLERAHENDLRLTGLPAERLARPAPVYLLSDRNQWTAMTEKMTGPDAAIYLSLENGGYCFRGSCVLWDMGHVATFGVAAHECMHQLLQQRLRDPLPAWVEEGLCSLAEGFALRADTVRFDPTTNPQRLTNLRDIISQDRWTPLAKLLASDASDYLGNGPTAPDYYAQLWAMMNYIRSEPRYRAGLERLLAQAAAGQLRKEIKTTARSGREYVLTSSVPAFRHYIDANLAVFEKEFRAYAKGLAKMTEKPKSNWYIPD